MIYAIDCDLHRLCCVSDDGMIVERKSVEGLIAELPPLVGRHDIVLFEIASAVDYTTAETVASQKAIAHQKRRWALFNVATAVRFHHLIEPTGGKFLVAPSSTWTHGYTEKERHRIAKGKMPNHDLREAEAMIYFYRASPTKWVTLPEFLAAL